MPDDTSLGARHAVGQTIHRGCLPRRTLRAARRTTRAPSSIFDCSLFASGSSIVATARYKTPGESVFGQTSSRKVKELMRPLCDRISGDPRGARGFGSYRKNCRSGRLLPRTATRVCASRIGASRKHAVRQKRRSTSYGGQIVRRHPKSGPVQNTVLFGTRHFGANRTSLSCCHRLGKTSQRGPGQNQPL